MRKRLIRIFITVIFVFCICDWAQTNQDTPAAKATSMETENTETQYAKIQYTNTKHSETQHTETEKPETEVESEPEKYSYIIDNDIAIITGFQEEYQISRQESMSMDSELKIPDTLGGHPVVEIGDSAFENIRLKSVELPDSVEIIGNSAFRNTNAEAVNLSQCYNLKEIRDYAFENCNLQEDQYNSTWFMEKIGERAFAGNERLSRVNFWSGDVVIGKEAFVGCGEELLFFVEWSREEAGKEVEAYAAANGIKVEYSVSTQINLPSEPLILTPETGSFFYGMLGGSYDDWGDDLWCSFEKTPDAPNFGFEDWQSPGCSKWCHIASFANQANASSELTSASDRYRADNVIHENRESAWAEGAEGAGIGEYIVYDQIVFSGSLIESNGNRIIRAGIYGDDGYIDYTQICIVNGYARDEKVWQENGRVKTLMMYVYDQPYAQLQLEDTINPQYFTIPEGDIRVANGGEVTFKFVIEEVYPGTLYEDTCITGIVADFGNVPDWH